MANIHILKKIINGIKTTIYPITIPQAVIDPADGKSLATKIEEVGVSFYEINNNLSQLAGDVSVKMKNLITNGEFTNGTAGWTPSNVSGFTVVDSVAQFTATSKGGSITHNYPLDYAGGKKYFFGAYVKANSPSVDISTAGIAATTHSGSGNWELLYAIASYSSGAYPPRIRDNSDNEWSPVYVRSVLGVSLSDVFGLGNEPTKTEFLLLLSIMGIEYFEGEITIPAQKVMQWQLKMIRQNRNAIVALGGTII